MPRNCRQGDNGGTVIRAVIVLLRGRMRISRVGREHRKSVLLCSPSAGGTIAAVRNLGLAGFDVGVAAGQRLSAAAWSIHASRVYSCPSESRHQDFLARLLKIGADYPGQILLPTSDQTAWLYTEQATVLDQYFRVYQPPIATIQRILDKKLLTEAALAAGISVLPSWCPRNLDEVADLAPNLPYPILIKPRTHVYRWRNDKGLIARSTGDLITQHQRFAARESSHNVYNPLIPDAYLPILQQFADIGSTGIHSVSGFIDRTGELFVARNAVKVLQRSRPVGVGVCFESLPAMPSLRAAALRLCRELSYFGIFEIEFLWFDGRWNLIDFNPRLFSQVGMDIRRGAPLPLLACLDAAGDRETLRQAAAEAQVSDEAANVVFFDRFTLRALLIAQILTLQISREERAFWQAWARKNASCAVDFAADATDPRPGIVHALSEIYLGIRAFPRFLRSSSRPMELGEEAPGKVRL